MEDAFFSDEDELDMYGLPFSPRIAGDHLPSDPPADSIVEHFRRSRLRPAQRRAATARVRDHTRDRARAVAQIKSLPVPTEREKDRTESTVVAALRDTHSQMSSLFSQLQILMQRRVAERAAHSSSNSASAAAECPICFENLCTGSVTTMCGHVYHKDCIELHCTATLGATRCPVCRAFINSAELVTLCNGLPEPPNDSKPALQTCPSLPSPPVSLKTSHSGRDVIDLISDQDDDCTAQAPVKPQQQKCSIGSKKQLNKSNNADDAGGEIDEILKSLLKNIDDSVKIAVPIVQLEQQLRDEFMKRERQNEKKMREAARRQEEAEKSIQSRKRETEKMEIRNRSLRDDLDREKIEIADQLAYNRKKGTNLDIRESELRAQREEVDLQLDALKAETDAVQQKERRLNTLIDVAKSRGGKKRSRSGDQGDEVSPMLDRIKCLEATLKRNGLSIPSQPSIRSRSETPLAISDDPLVFQFSSPASGGDDQVSDEECVVAQVDRERIAKKMKALRGEAGSASDGLFGSTTLRRPSQLNRPPPPRRGSGMGGGRGAVRGKKSGLMSFARAPTRVQKPSARVGQRR